MSDRDIIVAIHRGAREIRDVQQACGAGAECSGCHGRIDLLLGAVLDTDRVLRAS